jgi:predicted deacylase
MTYEMRDAERQDLVVRLRRLRDMIALGEKIAWGEDVEALGDAADEIDELRSEVVSWRSQANLKY